MSDRREREVPFTLSHTRGSISITYRGDDAAAAAEVAARHKYRLNDSFSDTHLRRHGTTITLRIDRRATMTIAPVGGSYYVTTTSEKAMDDLTQMFAWAHLDSDSADYKSATEKKPITCFMAASVSCAWLDLSFDDQGAAVSQTVDKTGLFRQESSGLRSIPSF